MTEAVIFDIDGTLANNYERMDAISRKRAERLGVTVEDLRTQHLPWTAEDWEEFHKNCHLDKPIGPVCSLLCGIIMSEFYDPIFVTGRMDICRKVTARWLWNVILPCPARPWLHESYVDRRLFMRPAGDERHGSVFKEDLLDKVILPAGWKPVLAFEDDPKISEMWRRRGILVAHVGEKLL